MFLHHGRALLLTQPPPFGVLPDWNDDHIGFGTRLTGSLQLCLEIVRHARHIVGFLGQTMHYTGCLEVLTEETALKVQKKLLSLAQLSCVNTKEQVRVIG